MCWLGELEMLRRAPLGPAVKGAEGAVPTGTQAPWPTLTKLDGLRLVSQCCDTPEAPLAMLAAMPLVPLTLVAQCCATPEDGLVVSVALAHEI